MTKIDKSLICKVGQNISSSVDLLINKVDRLRHQIKESGKNKIKAEGLLNTL